MTFCQSRGCSREIFYLKTILLLVEVKIGERRVGKTTADSRVCSAWSQVNRVGPSAMQPRTGMGLSRVRSQRDTTRPPSEDRVGKRSAGPMGIRSFPLIQNVVHGAAPPPRSVTALLQFIPFQTTNFSYPEYSMLVKKLAGSHEDSGFSKQPSPSGPCPV